MREVSKVNEMISIIFTHWNEYIKERQESREIFWIYFKSVFLKIKMSDYLFLNKLYVEIFYIWKEFYMKSLSSNYVMKFIVKFSVTLIYLLLRLLIPISIVEHAIIVLVKY